MLIKNLFNIKKQHADVQLYYSVDCKQKEGK